MKKIYVSAKVVLAEPSFSNKEGNEGKPGYTIYYPDGYISWCPAVVFDAQYREIGADIASLDAI